MKYILISLLLLLIGCNPCKYAAKHPECFPPDTVKIVEKSVHYEKEYITNDSIIWNTIPCDPVTNTVYDTKTVYVTNWKEKTDTIYSSKQVTKLNPINAQLKKDYEKEKRKRERNRKISFVLFGLLGLAILVIVIMWKFK